MVHSGSRATVEFAAIRATLRSVRVRIGVVADNLERAHPEWSLPTDARLTCLGTCGMVNGQHFTPSSRT